MDTGRARVSGRSVASPRRAELLVYSDHGRWVVEAVGLYESFATRDLALEFAREWARSNTPCILTVAEEAA